jgi:hypothetical protein
MVGIGGRVPNAHRDIRLGDVVISKPTATYGIVVQYDPGKTVPYRFEHIGSLNTPPMILLKALTKLRANHLSRNSKLCSYLFA